MAYASAVNIGRDISFILRPPRRINVTDAVQKYMRVPKGAGNSVPWEPNLTPYVIKQL